MRNGYSDNPTAHSFMKGTVSIRIQGSVATNPARGNCRRGEKRDPLHQLTIHLYLNVKESESRGLLMGVV